MPRHSEGLDALALKPLGERGVIDNFTANQ